MKFRLLALLALMGGASGAWADVIQLKDKATVTGKILSEKRDTVFVDLSAIRERCCGWTTARSMTTSTLCLRRRSMTGGDSSEWVTPSIRTRL